jgi:hypothetical protein
MTTAQALNAFVAGLFVLSFVYAILGLVAYVDRVKPDNGRIDISFTLSPIWPFFPDAYHDLGKQLCVKGKKLFWLLNIGGTAWLIMEHML